MVINVHMVFKIIPFGKSIVRDYLCDVESSCVSVLYLF